MGKFFFCAGDGRSVSVDGASETDSEDKEKEKLSTKKPAPLPLPEDMTVMQIDCGTFHTGELVFESINLRRWIFFRAVGAGSHLPVNSVSLVTDFVSLFLALLLHTGEVYMFGNGNHGQLGQGNNKVW